MAGVIGSTAVFLHRYLGIALALFFLMWFMSGLVLHYVPFPRLTPAERAASLPPLVLDRCRVSLAQALDALGLEQAAAVRLGMLADRPVYRMLPTGASAHWRVVFADNGERLSVDSVMAENIASNFMHGGKAKAVGQFDLDQWTVSRGLDAHRPLAEIDMQDASGTHLYVSLTSGEVVRDTTRAGRFWNWLGAIPHWIYPVQLRRHDDAWRHVVVWLSLPAVLLALTGLFLGVVRLRFGRRWAGRRVPFQKFFMRWHHVVGLVGGLLVLTWIFSGLMSMNPFRLYPPTTPDEQVLVQWKGGYLDRNDSVGPSVLQALSDRGVREIEWQKLRGVTALQLHASLNASTLFIPARQRSIPYWDAADIAQSLRDALPGEALESVEILSAYDDYYYARTPEEGDRPLPVLRASFANDVWYYIDLASGNILMRFEPANRIQRWLYHGLHSLDFPPLMQRPFLRETLILLFLLTGAGVSATGVVLAWKRLRKRPVSRSGKTKMSWKATAFDH